MSEPFQFEATDSPDFRPVTKPTRIESVEELEKLLDNIGTGRTPAPIPLVDVPRTPPPAPVPPPMKSEAASGKNVPFRPMARPPMAALCILDDGHDDGEWIRLRSDQFVIGRTEGDLTIPHDGLISVRHAQILRVFENETFKWKLVDLASKNGTYVRVNKGVLSHEQEVIIVSRKFRFNAPAQGLAAANDASPAQTRGWESVDVADVLPSLIEVTPRGDGHRIMLDPKDNAIGADRNLCNVALSADPTLAPRHARLYRDPRGLWQIENADPVNGVWVRIQRVSLRSGGSFQLGEQRFTFKTF